MKVSVITVVYNNRETVAGAIESVLGQQHSELEYIVVDGGSTDGTLEVINEYRDSISHIISEPDNGIYDAMNKGIARATGELIGILNSDDAYASNRVLRDVVKVFDAQRVDCVYGDLVYVSDHETRRVIRYWQAGEFSRGKFRWGWAPPHPTLFLRREVYEQHGRFNTDLNIAADYELMLRFLYKHRVPAAYVPEVLVCMKDGGTSNQSLRNRLRGHIQCHRAWAVNGFRSARLRLLFKPLSKLPQYLAGV